MSELVAAMQPVERESRIHDSSITSPKPDESTNVAVPFKPSHGGDEEAHTSHIGMTISNPQQTNAPTQDNSDCVACVHLDRISIGCFVRVDGLLSEKGKQLNLQEACVISKDAVQPRCGIRLLKDGKTVSVKTRNLHRIAAKDTHFYRQKLPPLWLADMDEDDRGQFLALIQRSKDDEISTLQHPCNLLGPPNMIFMQMIRMTRRTRRTRRVRSIRITRTGMI